MNEFLKLILKKSNVISENEVEPEPSQKAPFISNPTRTLNNACESVFEGSFTIPPGNTAIVTGTMTKGYAGGGQPGINGISVIYGSTNFIEGIYKYTVDLGNSGITGQASSYTLKIDSSNGKSVIKLFQRTSFDSSLYDTAPC